jgi:hypothetical protein
MNTDATTSPRATAVRRTRTGPTTLVFAALAIAVVGGPLGYLVGGALSPSIHQPAATSIAAAATADPATNAAHLVAFVVASYLLPVGGVALAWLAFGSRPWLATIGGLLAVAGWLPFSALTALDDVTNAMAGQASYAELLDRFSTDTVMTAYLLVYIVGHLVAYVLLGIATIGVIPRWAAWCLIVSSPVTVAAFVVPSSARLAVGVAALGLLVLGSVPAAVAVWSSRRVTA